MFKALAGLFALALVAGSAVAQNGDVQKKDAELVGFFNEIHSKTPPDAPERMAVDMLAEPSFESSCKILKGEIPASDAKKENARKDLEKRKAKILLGQNWPFKQREEVNVPYAKEKPALNGDLDTPAWNQGLAFHSEYNLDSLEEIKSGIEWRVLWDKSYFYIGVKVPDTRIVAIDYGKVKDKGPWNADCVEMFLLPSWRLKTYWEIILNPNGSLFDGLHTNNKMGWFISRPEEDVAGLKSFVKKFEGGYTVQVAVPFNELPNYMLGNKPEVGQTLYFSLVRVEDSQRRSPRPLLYDGHNIFGFFKATLVK